MTQPRRTDSGFSLIELVVAMTVTLIICGAVIQLLSAGKSAFRHEPELSFRQQNIRMGMNLVWNDVHGAGTGLPRSSQVFTDALDDVGALGPSGDNTDEIEIFSTAECRSETICSGFTGVSVTTWEPLSSCYRFPALVVLSNTTQWDVFWAEQPGPGGSAACAGGPGGGGGGPGGGGGGPGGGGGGGASNGHVVLPPGSGYENPPGGTATVFDTPPLWMSVIRVTRYRIAPEADGVPGLWRSFIGGADLPNGQSSWHLVARGVEDLQVQYLNGNGWNDTPGVVDGVDPNTIIRSVRITLSARATAANLKGQTTSAVGSAVRGQLVSEASPRAALLELGLF